MTDCARMHEYISARLDGELPPEQAEALSAHLAVCPACAALDSAMQALHSLCAGEAAVPPAALAPNVMRRIETAAPPVSAGKKRRVIRIAAGFAAAAACLALVLISLPTVLVGGRGDANECCAPPPEAVSGAALDGALPESTRCPDFYDDATAEAEAKEDGLKTADKDSGNSAHNPFQAMPQRAHTAEEFDCSILITIYGELPFDASGCETTALELDGVAAELITIDTELAQELIDTGLYDYSVDRSAENDVCLVLHTP